MMASAEALLAEVRGVYFRGICDRLGKRYDGLSTAAGAANKRGLLGKNAGSYVGNNSHEGSSSVKSDKNASSSRVQLVLPKFRKESQNT